MRASITILATAVAAIALAAAATGLLAAMERSLVTGRDEAARTRVSDLAVLAQANALPADLPMTDGDDFAMAVDTSGKVIAASANIAQNPPQLTPGPSGRTVNSVLANGEYADYRVWSASAGPVTVYIGSSLEAVEDAVSAVQQALLLGLPFLLALLAIGTWFVVGRALRPVEAIRAQVSDISSNDLHRRVPETGATNEIGRLAHTMNEMLARLQHSSERERQFAADAAHELQSPLAAFRTHLEVSLAHPDPAQWQQTAAELLRESQRMEQLVRDLLFLSRNESSPKGLADLDDIVLTEAARIRAFTQIRIDTSLVAATPVRGSRDELTRLTRNLLENAERHAATTVTVELTSQSGKARFIVADNGPGIPPGESEQIFHRFARLDDGRGRSTGGTGLGLSIVKNIAERHGGTVCLEPSAQGARFAVELPIA
jgi:signal transduction histidine kinase